MTFMISLVNFLKKNFNLLIYYGLLIFFVKIHFCVNSKQTFHFSWRKEKRFIKQHEVLSEALNDHWQYFYSSSRWTINHSFFCRLRRSIIISHMADNSSHFLFTPKINHRGPLLQMLSVISDTVQLFKCVCVHKKGYHLGYNTSPQGPYDPCQVPIVHSDG